MTAEERGDVEGVGARLRRTLVLGWRATGRGLVDFYNSNNITYASSIAYYALLSLFPFILLVLTVMSRVAVGKAGNEQAVVDLVERALPRDFEFLSTQVVQLQKAPIPLTIAGAIITVWASMGVFGAITSAVDAAWGTERPYSYFKHKLIAFLMMVAAAVVFAAALLLMGTVHVVHTSWFKSIEAWFPWLPNLTAIAGREAFMPAFILAIGLIYYFAPNTKVRLRDVWFGAILAAILWRLALALFSWYLARFAQFGVHGSVGTVVAFLVWVFVSAAILLYGVEVTAAYARARKAIGESQTSHVKAHR